MRERRRHRAGGSGGGGKARWTATLRAGRPGIAPDTLERPTDHELGEEGGRSLCRQVQVQALQARRQDVGLHSYRLKVVLGSIPGW